MTPQAEARIRSPLMLAAAMVALFLAALEQTILGPAIGRITADLGGGALLPWVATAYLVAATSTAPILGALADIIGRRKALLISIALFTGGSALAALAPSLPVLVLARAIQGAGAGGLTALPFVIIADVVPMSRRATVAAWTSTIYALASVLGPLVGGLLVERLDWSVIFWMNLPLGLLAALAVLMTPPIGAARRARRIDAPGAALLAVATASTITGIDLVTAGTRGFGVALLILGLSLFPLFVRRMARAADPLVPIRVMTERTILLNSLGLMCAQGTNIGLAIYLPLYWQQRFGLSPGQAGLALLGLLCGIMLGAYVPPRLLRRRPFYRPIILGAAMVGLMASIGLGLAIAMGMPLGGQISLAFCLGLTIGMLYPNFTLATQNAATPATMGASIGVLAFMRAMGGTLGASAAGIIAIGGGLGRTGSAAASAATDWPHWLLTVPAMVLMAGCLIAALAMPNRELTGFKATP
ncbi:MFS transporter [Pseudogemmobacter sonorensis]|uniref:MFS transporter n=1 Tax=Pseudogemmobacter sonorensis TaxID=2989681 RepID=UPI00367DBA28